MMIIYVIIFLIITLILAIYFLNYDNILLNEKQLFLRMEYQVKLLKTSKFLI